MDVGTRVVAKSRDPQQRESKTQTAAGDAEDPSQRAQETVTHSEEEASSSETTGAKDAAEQVMQTRDETRMQAEAA